MYLSTFSTISDSVKYKLDHQIIKFNAPVEVWQMWSSPHSQSRVDFLPYWRNLMTRHKIQEFSQKAPTEIAFFLRNHLQAVLPEISSGKQRCVRATSIFFLGTPAFRVCVALSGSLQYTGTWALNCWDKEKLRIFQPNSLLCQQLGQ